MKYEIRQLGLGGILDQAIKLTKNHLGLLLGISCALYLPYALVQGFVQLQTTPQLPPNPTAQDAMAFQQQSLSNLAITMPIVLLGLLIVIPITNAALIHAIASEYLEKPTTVLLSLKAALSKLPGLIGTWLLVYLAVFGGMILCVIPGIIASFWFALATQVFVIEGVAGIPALKRSKELMTNNIGTIFALGLLVGVITAGVVLGAAFITQPHARVVVVALVQAITTVFSAAAIVVFYFSCRCQHEQFDLTLLAQSVGVDAPVDEWGDAPPQG